MTRYLNRQLEICRKYKCSNVWPHFEQLHGFSPLCVISCIFQVDCSNVSSHFEKLYGFSPVWVISCIFPVDYSKVLSHFQHLYGFSIIVKHCIGAKQGFFQHAASICTDITDKQKSRMTVVLVQTLALWWENNCLAPVSPLGISEISEMVWSNILKCPSPPIKDITIVLWNKVNDQNSSQNQNLFSHVMVP